MRALCCSFRTALKKKLRAKQNLISIAKLSLFTCLQQRREFNTFITQPTEAGGEYKRRGNDWKFTFCLESLQLNRKS